MDIGKKIKILRNNLNITGKELSEITGINHGQIRKYETTKCSPQHSHILNIAKVLNVRPYVLLENNYEFILETYGDLFGLLITLNKIGFVSFSSYNTNTVMIEFNQALEPFLNFRNQTEKIDWEKLNVIVTDKLREHPNYPIFIQWVSNKNSLENFKKTASNKNALENLIPLEEQIEILELKLQQSTELLKDLQ